MIYGDLELLALEAKECDQAFTRLLNHLEPMCRQVASRYTTWMGGFDEVLQWTRIEVWNAVKTFEIGKTSFYFFCRMTMVNHIKSRLKRLYGKANSINRTAIRIDHPLEDETGPYGNTLIVEDMLAAPVLSTEKIVEKKQLIQRFYRILPTVDLTPLEYNCMVLYYFQECSYKEIQEILNLKSKKTVDNSLLRVKRKLARNYNLRLLYEDICV
ncbi:RNA polymerase sigma factor [Effusibacillus consociatus]|uniref:RNA polymerase sigma factor n=1 Tax=Effusibacillus consociatus TaxID=1117041 RepID=A0ABV9Q3G5_9BACL